VQLAPPTPIAKVTFAVLFVVATALMGYVIWPFRAPLFLALVLAAVFQRLLDRATVALRGRRRFAATLVTIAVFVVIVAPFASMVGFAVRQVVAGFGYLRDHLGTRSFTELGVATLPEPVARLFDRVLNALHLSREQLYTLASKYMGEAERGMGFLLTASSRFAFHTIIMLIAFYFLLLEGRRLIGWLSEISPLQAQQTRTLLAEFRRVSSASIIGATASALIQGVTATLGFLLTRVPHAIFFGLLCACCSFIPIVGTALVWVPAVMLLAIFHHHAAAIVLLIWCLVLVVGVEHIAKPIILRGQVEMHTGLVFLSLLGGIEMFGLIGIILGPLIVAFFLALTKMYLRDFVVQR
jgi:predicted PurR-regulated permease PerM